MKYMIEFELPDNDTVLREIKTADVAWGIWGYSGCTKAKPVQRWIPCSERLPKLNEYENDVLVYYLVQNEYGDMMVCSWNGRFWMQMYRNTKVKDQVVAWMPLPAPYIPEGDDKHEG